MYNMRTVQIVSFVLLSLSTLDGVRSDCYYFQKLETGKKYYVYNSEYPKKYEGENNCIWQTTSSYIIEVNCTIDMPSSDKCTEDSISVDLVGNGTYKYCGRGTFFYKGINASIKFYSPHSTEGGIFLCELQTETVIDEKPVDENNCICGWKNPTRIVGGRETGVNEYPAMAGLVDSIARILFCGATIISSTYVITAAHCLSNRNVHTTGVIVGEHDVSTGNETNVTKLYRIDKWIIHPQYDGNNKYDIAVCKIIGTIQYSKEVGPACLPFQHNCDSFGGDYVTVLGWGTLQFGGKKSNTLQKVELNVITNKKCSEHYNNVTRNEICTYTPGKDSCQMDSGGPVLWINPSTKNIVVIGIISSGIGCASKLPGISTRVGAYVKWITSVTPDARYCAVE